MCTEVKKNPIYQFDGRSQAIKATTQGETSSYDTEKNQRTQAISLGGYLVGLIRQVAVTAADVGGQDGRTGLKHVKHVLTTLSGGPSLCLFRQRHGGHFNSRVRQVTIVI